jgi:hypothetical protein
MILGVWIMSKTTIATIRKAINECPEIIGDCIESAYNKDDATFLLGLIKQAVRVSGLEQHIRDVHERNGKERRDDANSS